MTPAESPAALPSDNPARPTEPFPTDEVEAFAHPRHENQLTPGQAQPGVRASYPLLPVHRLFEQHARQQPTATVAFTHEHRLSFGELEVRSNRLARYLMAMGVGPDLPVGVCLRPSVEVMVALVAIYKAGGVYMPLDPSHPPALVQLMLDEARPVLVITHAQTDTIIDTAAGTAPGNVAWPQGTPRFCFDRDHGALQAYPPDPPTVLTMLSHGAFLLYTSGTTGKPKGVLATHGNLLHYIQVAQHRYRFQPSDVLSSIARYTFSISLFDLVTPLCVGCSVRLYERDDVLSMDRFCAALRQVTVLHAGPSLLSSLFRYLRDKPELLPTLASIRHASSGGDTVPPSVMREMAQVFSQAEVYVIYGCTEISCMGTTFDIRAARHVTTSMVGSPFADVTVRVLDAQRQVVPFGEVGEIAFAGRGVSKGYLDRPELTAQKYVHLDGQRFYLTGDLGRLHREGGLEMLGRSDFQVQLRGMRIELTGLENCVRDLNLAFQCVATVKNVGENDNRLVAYVVSPQGDLAGIRRELAQHLPDYMVPQHVIELESLPVTTNGKVDRHHLNQMPLNLVGLFAQAPAPRADTEGVPSPVNAHESGNGNDGNADPETLDPVQAHVSAVFKELLGVTTLGLDDNFFDLGGHSLLAVVAIQEINDRVGSPLEAHVLFEQATVRSVARHITAAAANAGPVHPILLNSSDVHEGSHPSENAKLFMLGGVHMFRELARQLDGRVQAYGVFTAHEVQLYNEVAGAEAVVRSIPQLASDYIAAIRQTQPQGPYFILGFSFTGIVAYEVAQQLREQGETVQCLAMVDPVLPEWTLGWRYRVSQFKRAMTLPPWRLAVYLVERLRASLLGAPSTKDMLFYGENPHTRAQDKARVEPLDAVRIALNAQTAAAYLKTIRPYAGKTSLIMSGRRLERDPLKSATGGWAAYLRDYTIHSVDTDHLQMLTEHPHVGDVADMVVRSTGEPASRLSGHLK